MILPLLVLLGTALFLLWALLRDLRAKPNPHPRPQIHTTQPSPPIHVILNARFPGRPQ